MCSPPSRMPAFATTTSAGPSASRSLPAAASTASQSVMSATAASASPPEPRISSTIPASASAWTSQQPTRSPIEANRRACEAPIPLAAPVTQTVRGSLIAGSAPP